MWPGNIEILFEESGVPKDLDLLVIDIDSKVTSGRNGVRGRNVSPS